MDCFPKNIGFILHVHLGEGPLKKQLERAGLFKKKTFCWTTLLSVMFNSGQSDFFTSGARW